MYKSEIRRDDSNPALMPQGQDKFLGTVNRYSTVICKGRNNNISRAVASSRQIVQH